MENSRGGGGKAESHDAPVKDSIISKGGGLAFRLLVVILDT